MPPGGDGYYYFSSNLLGHDRELSLFDIKINGDTLCTVRVEQHGDVIDFPQSPCSAAIFAADGIFVVVITEGRYRDNNTSGFIFCN